MFAEGLDDGRAWQWTPADGVLRSRRGESRNLATGEWLGTTVVRSVEPNAALEDDFFEGR